MHPKPPISNGFEQTRREHLRSLAAIGLASGLGLLSSGCRPKGRTLRCWTHYNGFQLQQFNAVLDPFRRAHPEITIDLVQVHSDHVRQRWLAGLKSGRLPDLILLNSSWLRSRGVPEQLVDLSAEAEKLQLKERLWPRDYERCLRGSALLALPLSTAAGGTLFYRNVRCLEAAGFEPAVPVGNWAEFTELSSRVVRRLNDVRGALKVLAWDPFSMSGAQLFVALCMGVGSPPISEDGRSSHLMDTGVRRVFAAINNHVEEVYRPWGGWRGVLRWRNENFGMRTPPLDANHPFVQGKQAFAMTGVWVAGALLKFRELCPFDVGPVPGLDTLHGGISAHGWSYAINAQSPNREAAWTLLQYLTIDPQGNGRLCVDALRPSPLRSMSDHPGYLVFGKVWEHLREAIALDIPYPYSIDSDVLRPLFAEWPYRSLGGASDEEVLRDFHIRIQNSLTGMLQEVGR